jgi:hypothetical protein
MNQQPTDKPLDPIMVMNPHTGRYVNVAPLFEVQHETYSDSLSQMATDCDGSIRMITASMQDWQVDEAKNRIYGLYVLRDMFNQMTEFEERKH